MLQCMSLFAACLMCVLCMGTVDVDTCSSVNLCIVCIINVTPFVVCIPSDYTVSASLHVQEGTTFESSTGRPWRSCSFPACEREQCAGAEQCELTKGSVVFL